MTIMLAVDIGGTFTDLASWDVDTGALTYTKSPTTYDDFGRGVFECIRKSGIALDQAAFVKHGTTLIINALLQRSGARTALVTTRGFRDVLEIGRGNRTEPFNLRFRRDPPLIERQLRFEASERMMASGEVRRELDIPELEDLAIRLRALDIQAVAVSFLNSYANPVHEQQAARHLARLLPDVFVSTGSQLSGEWFEFERTATVAANAYVGPQCSAYIDRLEADLTKRGFTGSLLLMGSHGGVVSVSRVRREPISLVESGPVGGCIGAATLAQPMGFENVIAFDMGGTTAKCALIERGRYLVESTYYVGGPAAGFPIRGSVVDIVEVGAGGGSVAWIDKQGRLQVGPRSAGSTPGPACYGRGGSEPTVTDANLLLGRLDANSFLGGEMHLDIAAAARAMKANLADPLAFQGDKAIERAADGVLAIANLIMTEAIKQVSIARGLDPRDYVLFCYGGGGPLHGCELARELHIPKVVVPLEPGNFSAVGMLLADARLDNNRTFVADLDETSLARLEQIFIETESRSRTELQAEFQVERVVFERKIELRYKGQKHSLRIAMPDCPTAALVQTHFNEGYKRRYGHSRAKAPIEIVGLQSTGILAVDRPKIAQLGQRSETSKTISSHMRPVYFREAGGFVPTPVYQRSNLPIGFARNGPSLVEEYGSTTLIGPNDSFVIGELREIRIDCSN